MKPQEVRLVNGEGHQVTTMLRLVRRDKITFLDNLNLNIIYESVVHELNCDFIHIWSGLLLILAILYLKTDSCIGLSG